MKFIAVGGNVNYISTSQKSYSCLHICCVCEELKDPHMLECIELLLQNGADINMITKEEGSSGAGGGFKAAGEGGGGVGGEGHGVGEEGKSMLDLAVEGGKDELIAFLLAKLEGSV